MPSANLPIKLECRYVEADNGLAERLHNALIFGRKATLLRERYHIEMGAFRFLQDMMEAGAMTENVVREAKELIVKFCNAHTQHTAEKIKNQITDTFDDSLKKNITKVATRLTHKTSFENRIAKYLFKAPQEVCNFGRKNCTALKVASGPDIEGVNSAVKGRRGTALI